MQANSDFFRYLLDNGRSHNELWDAVRLLDGVSSIGDIGVSTM